MRPAKHSGQTSSLEISLTRFCWLTIFFVSTGFIVWLKSCAARQLSGNWQSGPWLQIGSSPLVASKVAPHLNYGCFCYNIGLCRQWMAVNLWWRCWHHFWAKLNICHWRCQTWSLVLKVFSIVIVSGLMCIAYMLTWIIFTFCLWANRGNTLRWKHKVCTGCSVFKISFSVWYGRRLQ